MQHPPQKTVDFTFSFFTKIVRSSCTAAATEEHLITPIQKPRLTELFRFLLILSKYLLFDVIQDGPLVTYC